MIRMKIGSNSPYLEELQYVLAKMGSQAKVLPRTAAAMEAGAKLIQARWVEFAGGGALEGVKKLERPRGGYARSIRTERLGPYSHEVYSEAEVADWIENGTEILDMKRTHPFGPRSRVSEDGIPYLIVPFQWGTKEGTKRAGPRNIVPKNLLSSMRNKKRFERSTVKGKYRAQESGRRAVERATYSWGDRVPKSGDITDGMVRFEQGSAADSTTGTGKRYGGYFTFRVISARSPKNSWIKPAMPARNVTRALEKETQEPINAMVENAIMEDFRL